MANEKMDFMVLVWGKGFELTEELKSNEDKRREVMNRIYSEPDEVKHFSTFKKMDKWLNSKEAQRNWDNEVCFNEAAMKYVEQHSL